MRNRSPRLLVLASTFPGAPGDGTPAFVRDLALQQAKTFEVLVVTPRVPGGAAVEETGGVRVERFRYFPRRWESLAHGAIIENLRSHPSAYLQVVPFVLAEAWAVRRAVRRFRPDVIHAHWIIPQGLVATLVAPSVPRVVTTLGGDLYALNTTPLRRLKSWVVRHAKVVTVMNAEMSQIVSALGAPAVQVLPMGADLASFRDAAELRTSEAGALRLLFVGRLVEKKGLAVLFDALRDVTAPFHLTVVGDGPLRAALEERAAGLPVTFVGQQGRADLARLYVEHDVVVVPSVLAVSGDKDGLPVAMLEAMGAGCAVIGSDLPGINEAVQNGVSGLLVPSGDAAALSAALERLAGDPHEVANLGKGAAHRAEAFSVEAVGRRYAGVLTDVARV